MEDLVTTFLQMRSALEIRKSKTEFRKADFEIQELKEPNWKFNREMYFKVGEQWRWIDKRPWTDAQWKEYASDPNLRTFAGYGGESLIGFYELKRSAAAPFTRHSSQVTRHIADVEIAYFGLLPEFIGRGLGGALLTSAIENAWAWMPAPSRIWVHTCNRDHPSALNNYKARGFKIYQTVTGDV
ncbi:MAG TPA: GNAT family N-acetyltransferase [Chthoniobacterales bacterium]|nr:GNAT family N-acetyltransferase [Chthoniobacterales bacterium]